MIDFNDRPNLMDACIAEEGGNIRAGLKLFNELLAGVGPVAPAEPTTVVAAAVEPPPSHKKAAPNGHTAWSDEDVRIATEMAAVDPSIPGLVKIAQRLGRSKQGIYNGWYSGKFERPGVARKHVVS